MTACPECGQDTAILLERAERAEKRAETYRVTLMRIAGAESGVWGTWAQRALAEAEDA